MSNLNQIISSDLSPSEQEKETLCSKGNHIWLKN